MRILKEIILASVLLLSFLLAACTNVSKFSKRENWINSNIDGNLLSEKPSLKDDFYQAENYENLKNMSLKDGTAMVGGARNMQEILTRQISQLTREEEKYTEASSQYDSEKQMFISLYKMCLDWEKRNALGVQPVIPVIRKIQNIKSISDFEKAFADDELLLIFPIKMDLKNNNGSYYVPALSLNFLFANNSDEYTEFYNSMLIKCGFSESEADTIVQQALNFENNYNFNIVKNKVSEVSSIYSTNLKREYPNFPLAVFFEAYGVSDLTYLIKHTQEFKIFDSLFTEQNLEAIKALCICKLLVNSSRLLDRECFEYASILNHKLYGAFLNPSEYGAVNQILDYYASFFLGKIWSMEFCSDEIITDVENLSYEIIDGYKKQIQVWDWLDNYSRSKLFDLLDKLKVIVGYSSFYDYSDYELRDNVWDSILQLGIYEKKTQAKKCYKYLDVYEWIDAPQLFNAFYNSGNNSINLFAGYIYGINYDINAPLEEKYGLLGTMIAHEISHSFSLYDSRDSIIQILTSDSHKALEKKLNTMADYFSTFEVIDGKKCNGQKCKGEIGADIFGMATLLKIAFEKPDFDYSLFFKTYAKRNFAKYTENINRLYFETDSHPSDFLRTNAVVQQFDEFYDAFDINRGDGMYLAPEKRFKL